MQQRERPCSESEVTEGLESKVIIRSDLCCPEDLSSKFASLCAKLSSQRGSLSLSSILLTCYFIIFFSCKIVICRESTLDSTNRWTAIISWMRSFSKMLNSVLHVNILWLITWTCDSLCILGKVTYVFNMLFLTGKMETSVIPSFMLHTSWKVPVWQCIRLSLFFMTLKGLKAKFIHEIKHFHLRQDITVAILLSLKFWVLWIF